MASTLLGRRRRRRQQQPTAESSSDDDDVAAEWSGEDSGQAAMAHAAPHAVTAGHDGVAHDVTAVRSRPQAMIAARPVGAAAVNPASTDANANLNATGSDVVVWSALFGAATAAPTQRTLPVAAPPLPLQPPTVSGTTRSGTKHHNYTFARSLYCLTPGPWAGTEPC